MKKIKRRNLLFTLIAVVIVLTVFDPCNVQAAGKTKLNVTKKTIYVGESYTVKILNNTKKVKWSATNKNIKIISKNNKQAKIKGVKKGTSYLKAKVKGKTYKCKVAISAQPKLDASSKTILVGDSTIIRISNARGKVDWSVNNSCIQIAKKTNSYAEIKGIRKGTGYLEAKVGKKTYKCKISVKKASTPTPPVQPVKTYAIGETWIVDGQWKVTVNSVEETADRNPYSEKNPAAVYLVTYTYENIGYVDRNGIMDGLYISMDDTIVDATGKMGYSYPGDQTLYAQETPVGATCEAQVCIGVDNAGSFKIHVTHYDGNGNKQSAVFSIDL